MNFGSMKFGQMKIVAATAVVLLLSIAQPAGAGGVRYGIDSMHPVDSGSDRAFSRGLIDIDEAGFLGDSNARVVLSGADELGQISVIEMRSNESARTHYNFRSNATGALLSATLETDGADYALTYNLPAGQILLENDTISVMTASNFSQVNLPGGEMPEPGNGQFARVLNEVLRGSDIAGFNLSMAESMAENDLLSLSLVEERFGKGYDQYAEGGWACGGALLALAAANAALAAAIAATYATAGMAAMTIAAAVSAIAAAITMVDLYCLQR